eukprot:scaffold22751_cov141-Cylindrotheca_fusiformis.AAC.3
MALAFVMLDHHMDFGKPSLRKAFGRIRRPHSDGKALTAHHVQTAGIPLYIAVLESNTWWLLHE